ncbi:MAG: tetratricopeptide repeat protein [Dermatophilaceae bacterium]|nr:tetratricopeptide repeat protein [Intrasporangiaceae bacterium]
MGPAHISHRLWKKSGALARYEGMTAFDRYRYAQRLFSERRYTAAARELEHLISDQRDHGADAGSDETYSLGDAPLLLARSYYQSAQLARAETAARALIEADPTDVYAVLLLARTLQRRGRHAEAGTWLRRLDAMGYDTWSDEFSPVTSDEPSTPRRSATHAA